MPHQMGHIWVVLTSWHGDQPSPHGSLHRSPCIHSLSASLPLLSSGLCAWPTHPFHLCSPSVQSMVAGGPWPDVVSYNTLIAAAASGGNVRVAMRIFSNMVDAGVLGARKCQLHGQTSRHQLASNLHIHTTLLLPTPLLRQRLSLRSAPWVPYSTATPRLGMPPRHAR